MDHAVLLRKFVSQIFTNNIQCQCRQGVNKPVLYTCCWINGEFFHRFDGTYRKFWNSAQESVIWNFIQKSVISRVSPKCDIFRT